MESAITAHVECIRKMLLDARQHFYGIHRGGGHGMLVVCVAALESLDYISEWVQEHEEPQQLTFDSLPDPF